MNVLINNHQQEFTSGTKLTDALETMNIPYQRGVAVAINNSVLPRADWDDYTLQPGDKVILIKATQGG